MSCVGAKTELFQLSVYGLLYFAQDAQYLRKEISCAIYAQDLCKIVLLSPMHNICARLAQDCSAFQYLSKICAILYFFPNVQYMHKICTRLYFFPNTQCMRKIVLLSPMRNICTRFVQDCTSFPSVQYMHKIEAIIGRNMSLITYLL